MNREDQTEAPNEEIAGAPTLDSDEASRALARVQQVLDSDEDRARALEKAREKAEKAARAKSGGSEKPDEGDKDDEARPLTPEAAQQLRDILEPLHPADIAWVLEALPLDDRLAVWNQVQSESDGDILLEVNEGVRETLIEAMDRDELVDAVETLDTDQIADLVDDLPPDVMAEVQEGLSHEERAQLRAAMSYPEDSVGARMDFEMVSIREEVTIDMVLRYLRRFKELPDHMDQIFVVDRLGRLKGALAVAQILTSDPAKQVRRIMQTETFTLNPLDDASDAAQAFERYDLVSAAVVDEAGRLVGRLTVNEVVDVIREESDEDAFSAVGLDDEQDLFGSVWGAAKSRWLWLGVNLCTAFFASRVLSAFDGTIDAHRSGHGRQFRQSNADAFGALACHRTGDAGQYYRYLEEGTCRSGCQRPSLGRHCRPLCLGALLGFAAGAYARSGHGACDVPQHRPGSGCRTCCAAHSE